jgi:hypothetical protein
MTSATRPVNGKGNIMKYIMSLAVAFFSTASLAQTSMLPVECGTMQELTKVLAEYDEKPFAIGDTQRMVRGNVAQNHVLFFVNPKTKTWTVAEKFSDNLYCVVSGGMNFSLVTTDKGI